MCLVVNFSQCGEGGKVFKALRLYTPAYKDFKLEQSVIELLYMFLVQLCFRRLGYNMKIDPLVPGGSKLICCWPVSTQNFQALMIHALLGDCF